MNKRTLFPLFGINFIVYFVGTGLVPLLPLYAEQFGISAGGAGFYVAFIFVSITVGTVLTGRLAGRFSARTLFLLAGWLGVPTLALLGRAGAFWQVVLLTGFVWFLAGIGTALVSVQAGLRAPRDKRGQSFGLLFLALPSSLFLAGMSLGRLLEWQGFPFLFDMLAILWAVWPLLIVLGFREGPRHPVAEAGMTGGDKRPRLGLVFHVLVVTTLLSATTFYLARLGVSISLSALGFSPSAISSTSVVGGLVAIPATYGLGVLSDKLPRRYILLFGYLLAAGAMIILSVATDLRLFWLATGLLYLNRSISGSVAPAYATDLLSKEKRSYGLPLLSAGNWLAAVFGSAIAGIGLEALGQVQLFLLATGLALSAFLLLALTGGTRHAPARFEQLLRHKANRSA